MPIIKERALSPLFCKNAPVGFHCDGGGLYLSARPLRGGEGVTRSWIFRYRRLGRLRDLGLGPTTTVGLAAARERARAARQKLLDGVDPIEERRAAKVASAVTAARRMSFEECADSYIEANRSGWKNAKHADQWRSTLLTYAYPVIGALPVDVVEVVHVMKILEPIWSTKTETASRVRGRIEKILDRAKALKLRSGENPARWVGHLDQLLPKKSQVAPVENHPALPYAQLPEFMADLRRRDGFGARALEYSILTAARTADTIGGKWTEIDLRDNLWTVPKDRMKGQRGARKRDHVVPLVRQTLAILAAMPRGEGGGEYLFPGNPGEPLSNAAMAAVIDRMNEDRVKAGLPKWVDPQQGGREIVPHGFRSTFKDWCTEETEYPNEMSEMALAHTLPDKVEAAYRRGNMRERRRHMMADWATFAANQVAATRSQITPVRPGISL
jgi:integrase